MFFRAFLMCALFFFACAVFANPVEDYTGNAKPFGLWLEEFKKKARAAGVREDVVVKALGGLMPNERVIRLDRKQPESRKSFTQYLADVVSTSRIDRGRKLYRKHRILLEEIGGKYGVQPRFIVALWGIETNYGGFTGNMPVIESLATLAYDGRREELFTNELLKALKILQEGHITLEDMTGSWAGAMGQSQFMPSSFLNFAVDYNGDGHKDIWNTTADVFASIANYLAQSGWNDELTWGRMVLLPTQFDDALADIKARKPLKYWHDLGVKKADKTPLPAHEDIIATVIYPGEHYEDAYLIYNNYHVLLQWNRSRYFATAVGTLSDAIAY